MTKLQTWNEAIDIIANLGLTKKNETIAMDRFEALLAPKKSGGSRPEPIVHNGELHYYDRYTGLYFPSSQMVYQNDEARELLKDKGYSALGISLWNKGQKYLKDLKMKSVEIAYGDDQSDETLIQGRECHIEAKKLTDEGSMNNYTYLMEHFLSDDQADMLEGLDLPAVTS